MDIGVAYKLCHTKTNPAYYPDTQPPAHESDIRVLSYNIEEILKSARFPDLCPQLENPIGR